MHIDFMLLIFAGSVLYALHKQWRECCKRLDERDK